MTRTRRQLVAALVCGAALASPLAAEAQSGTPKASTLSRGWETREQAARPAPQQQAPPEESAPEGTAPSAPTTQDPAGLGQDGPLGWTRTAVPSVFDAAVAPADYPGEVRRYRLRFKGPKTPRGWSWGILFEQVRRAAYVYLNGKRIGANRDPYTPFTVPAKGLRPGRTNELLVVVDSRKDPRLPEGWWNWGGIVRPVRLVPVGPAHLDTPGLMPKVSCKGPATRCRASLLIDGELERNGVRQIQPRLDVRLRAPGGRITKKTFKLPRQRSARRRLRLSMKVPAPTLWRPERPALYDARVTLRERGRTVQTVRKQIGMRSVQVKGGLLHLNNRRILLRGASIHEDMPGRGAALTNADMDRIVADLKSLGANVTRSHYVLSERLLSKLDRAGIMVWNQAPIWQRDHRANLLRYPSHRKRALLTVRRTVKAARSHPSVITHSVANELSFIPDRKPGTARFLTDAQAFARDLDPTVPISLDIKSRAGGTFPEQFTYHRFDMIGINQYFGWYRWVENFDELEPYLNELRDLYPDHALVNTEFGSEARPENADAPADYKGGYAFQADHTGRTLDVIDRSPFMSGAIYWTLREFEIYPGWTGGAGRRSSGGPNTRHHKGLMTYEGQPKPAFGVARDHFSRTPLYP